MSRAARRAPGRARSRTLPAQVAWVVCLAALACSRSPAAPPPPECAAREDCPGGLAGGLLCTGGKCAGCERSRDCRLSEVCDPVQRRCTLRACFGDACARHEDCAAGQFCVQGLCLDPAPATPQPCTVTLCGTVRDCNAGERCNLRTFVCEQDLGCLSGAPCAAGTVCNEASGLCVPGCTEATAEQVCGPLVPCRSGRCVQCAADADCGPGLACDVFHGVCAGGFSCQTSRDCQVPLVCDRPTGFCAQTRPPCVSSASCASDERCESRTGLCVPGACLPDRFAPNQTPATAAPLKPGTHAQLTLCDREEDWYALSLLSGDRVQVVSDTDPLGSFDLSLTAPGGQLLAEAPTALLATAGSTGTYLLRARTNDDSAVYGLRFQVRAGQDCVHSPPEPHLLPAQALPVGAGRFLDYAVCPGEDSWFLVRTAGGVAVDAALDPTAGGALLLALLDSDATTSLAGDATGSAAPHVEAAGSHGGQFFLRVRGALPTVQNRYDLTIRLLGPLP